METTTFDGITRTLSHRITRRSALRGLFAGAVAGVAGGAVLQADDAAARRRRKQAKKGRKRQQTLRPGAFCQSSGQCQTDRGYVCAVAVNAGNSDRTCSGATGAVCGAPNTDGDATAPFCAVGYSCTLTSQSNQTGTGICQLVPVEI